MTSPTISTPDGAQATSDRAMRVLTACERLACVAIVIGLVVLRIHFARHAGGLWRDEVHSVDVAGNSQFPLWQDSFPSLWIAFLRGWITVGRSAEDAWMRMAGLVTSLLLLIAAWWAPQGRSWTIPWTSLVLLGFSPVAITYGTEVRGYALGVAAELWMLGALHRCLLKPSRWGYGNLVIASLVAVQAAYANSFLLLAGSLAAGIVCLIERRWWTLLGIAANGVVAAATVSPYILVLLPQMSGDWEVIMRHEFPLTWYLQRMLDTFGSAGIIAGAAWFLLLGVAAFGALRKFANSEDQRAPVSGDPKGMFELGTLVLGTVLVLAYVKWLKLPTQAWYYLPVLGLWAFCIDSLSATWRQSPSIRLARLATAVLLAAIQIPTAREAANLRLSNVDVAARAIADEATSHDLVVVKPWYFGIPFKRYYRGSASWITLPEIKETEVPGELSHADGYRAVKAAMMREDAIAEELSRIRGALKDGGRVYLLGQVRFLRPGELPFSLPPAPSSKFGWSEGIYESSWTQQLCFELQTHSTEIRRLPVKIEQPVHPYENCQVHIISGWRDDSPEPGQLE